MHAYRPRLRQPKRARRVEMLPRVEFLPLSPSFRILVEKLPGCSTPASFCRFFEDRI